MYTIKQAAARAGLSVPVLRAWERRYGIVEPARTAAGYRMYDEQAIARIRAMRRLVDEGWSPSAAAAALRDSGSVDAAFTPGISSPASSDAEGGPAVADAVDAFARSAATLDAGGLERALDEMFGRATFEVAFGLLVAPALRQLGRLWERGEIDVAAEHAASQAVLRRLAAAFQAAGRPADPHRSILVGLPPGSHHEIGALAFATAARRAGLPVLYLGPDLPLADWASAAASTAAIAAVVGVVCSSDVGPAADVVAALRSIRPDIVVAFGGRAATEPPAAVVALRLPDDLLAAVDALRAALPRPF